MIAKTNHFFGVYLLFFHRVPTWNLCCRLRLFLLKHLQIVLHILYLIHWNDNSNKIIIGRSRVHICWGNNSRRLLYKILCSRMNYPIASTSVGRVSICILIPPTGCPRRSMAEWVRWVEWLILLNANIFITLSLDVPLVDIISYWIFCL